MSSAAVAINTLWIDSETLFQICGGILHLTSLLGRDDMRIISPLLSKDGDFLATCLDKYYTARQPESQIGKLPTIEGANHLLHMS